MKGYAILFIALVCVVLICGCVVPLAAQKQVTTPQQVTSKQPVTIPVKTGPAVTVMIKNRAFDPSSISISEGTTVTWINEDPTLHRVVHLPSVKQAELFNSGPLSPGQSYSYRFMVKGLYEYGDPNIGGGRTASVVVV